MRPLTEAEQQIASDPKLLEVCESVARGFARTHCGYGDRLDEFLSACHEALMQTAQNFDPQLGAIKSMLTTFCQQRCIDVARAIKRRIQPERIGVKVPAVCDVGYKRVEAAADAAELLEHATPKQRRVLLLRLKGWSFKNISLAIGQQKSSVIQSHNRFVFNMQRRLGVTPSH